MSGSGLSPWAIVPDPAKYAAVVARHVNCSPGMYRLLTSKMYEFIEVYVIHIWTVILGSLSLWCFEELKSQTNVKLKAERKIKILKNICRL